MNIIVCIKQVPDTETRIKIGADKKSIDPTDINWILNPYDEYAVEEALRIKEKQGNTTVTVISVGPERTTSALRNALAMGADEAVLIKTDQALDSLATSKALAAVIKDMPYDLILAGKQGVDDDNLQVGPMVAELLNIPCVTYISELKLENGKATVKREIEGGMEIVETTLPALFTAEKGLNEPRYPALRGIMMAKKKIIQEKQVSIDPPKIQIVNIEYPPTRKGGKIVGQGVDAVPELVRLLREEAKAI
ncbi:MAG: electron transfer flavoprotein subunit beta/FixA family protein [candidate division KSB1 bacterium]|nr:electron transfer flavoprotein subunit beta/FixA family protein [candidate division KSB1 bacterium]MDZ7336289.1 electron transfer flavoprotein subunit beta/FixA family protein [candidate division KSB1 bacterium]MDZ7358102.1 electron transfer flavoprotein subunit beta/FixA family protein [candidate division KSB1 bacterium]MDZ7399501.1 electron transfer flavoprotein subunit beta/FixA family protein [candidate division KSB1 bacterium]